MIDPQNFIDRMLETENLTDALEDEDADYLLNWGVAQLKEKLGKFDDKKDAGEYTNALMSFMRTVNQITGNLESIQPEDLVHRRAAVLRRDRADRLLAFVVERRISESRHLFSIRIRRAGSPGLPLRRRARHETPAARWNSSSVFLSFS